MYLLSSEARMIAYFRRNVILQELYPQLQDIDELEISVSHLPKAAHCYRLLIDI